MVFAKHYNTLTKKARYSLYKLFGYSRLVDFLSEQILEINLQILVL